MVIPAGLWKRNRKVLWRRSGSVITEWTLAFCVCVFAIWPVVDLAGFLFGVATCNFIAYQTASATAASKDLAAALANMKNQAESNRNSPLGQLVKLYPVKGYQGCGVDLYVGATGYSSNTILVYGPNTGVPPPIDTSTYVYEYETLACYEIVPLITMSNLPYFKDMAIVGKPTRVTFSCKRMVESPDGLVGPGALAMTGGGNGTGSGRGGSGSGSSFGNPGTGTITNPPGWNYPKLNFFTVEPSTDPNNPGFYVMNVYTVPCSGGVEVWVQGNFVNSSSNPMIDTENKFRALNNPASFFGSSINPGQNISPYSWGATAVGPGLIASLSYGIAEGIQEQMNMLGHSAALEAQSNACELFANWCKANNF